MAIALADLPKGLRWDYHFQGAYRHSNKYATEGTDADAQSILSVNSLTQMHELRISYRIKKATIRGIAEVNWTQMHASNTRSTNSLTPILTMVYRFIHHLYGV